MIENTNAISFKKEMIENTNTPTGHKPMLFCFCGGSFYVFIILYFRTIHNIFMIFMILMIFMIFMIFYDIL